MVERGARCGRREKCCLAWHVQRSPDARADRAALAGLVLSNVGSGCGHKNIKFALTIRCSSIHLIYVDIMSYSGSQSA